ncbi:MAG: DUF4412 domain-containing protein [Emcibacteraceae bacterium]
MTNFKTNSKILFSALFISLISTPLYAGEIIEIINKDLRKKNAQEETMQVLFSDGNMKMKGMEGNEMIFDGAAQNMTVISHQDKSYMIFDKSTAGSVKSQMDAAMEKALANVPPEQRAMVEKMMKQRMSSMGGQQQMQMPQVKTEIKKTGKNDTINGYACDYYEAYRGDQKQGEYCITSWSDLDVGEDIQTSFKNMAEFMKGFMEELSKMSPVRMDDNPFNYMNEMEGFPVLSRQFSNGQATHESMLSSISNQDIDESEFIAPEGYKQRNLMGQ